MNIINQLDYAALPYPTTLTPQAALCAPYPTVAQAGCGVCCVCMMVERLTGRRLTVEEGVSLSVEAGANRNGTDMKRLGAFLAERYHLRFSWSDDLGDLSSCLNAGGAGILNVGGSTEDRVGTFSQNGHFIFAFEQSGKQIRIADPSYTTEKYRNPDRARRVSVGPDQSVVVPEEVLAQDLAMRSPSLFLFQQEMGTSEG